MNKPLVFEHLPKTAGSTFRYLLRNHYSRFFTFNWQNAPASYQSFNNLSQNKRHHFQVIEGHGTSVLMPLLTDYFSITYLRDPVKRFLSQYYYINRSRHHKSFGKTNSIEAYIEYAYTNHEDNLQTRFLSNYVMAFLPNNGIDKPMPSIEQLLSEAMHKLSSIDAVFLTEHFDESILILKQLLGWKKNPYYVRKKQNKYLKEAISSKQLEMIAELEKYDIRLYEKAKIKNDELLAQYNLGDTVATFRQKNENSKLKIKAMYYWDKYLINK